MQTPNILLHLKKQLFLSIVSLIELGTVLTAFFFPKICFQSNPWNMLSPGTTLSPFWSCVRISIWTSWAMFHHPKRMGWRNLPWTPAYCMTIQTSCTKHTNYRKSIPCISFFIYYFFPPHVFAPFIPHNGWGRTDRNKFGLSTLSLLELALSQDLAQFTGMRHMQGYQRATPSAFLLRKKMQRSTPSSYPSLYTS